MLNCQVFYYLKSVLLSSVYKESRVLKLYVAHGGFKDELSSEFLTAAAHHNATASETLSFNFNNVSVWFISPLVSQCFNTVSNYEIPRSNVTKNATFYV